MDLYPADMDVGHEEGISFQVVSVAEVLANGSLAAAPEPGSSHVFTAFDDVDFAPSSFEAATFGDGGPACARFNLSATLPIGSNASSLSACVGRGSSGGAAHAM